IVQSPAMRARQAKIQPSSSGEAPSTLPESSLTRHFLHVPRPPQRAGRKTPWHVKRRSKVSPCAPCNVRVCVPERTVIFAMPRPKSVEVRPASFCGGGGVRRIGGGADLVGKRLRHGRAAHHHFDA